MHRRRWPALGLVLALAGCGLTSNPAPSGSTIEVVAAENFWGSIVKQVGGDRVHVTSIIVNPDTDPHSYEARPDDAKAIARARYVVLNGAGYDPWVPQLLAANTVSGRRVLIVGELLGKKEGDNPHFWYSPQYVDRVIDRVTEDLRLIAPADAGRFDQQSTTYKITGLMEYKHTIAAIRQKYSGTPVGATESIFVYLANPLGLNLLTPPEYMKAMSEGTDPSAADKVTTHEQITRKQIKVLVFNSQNTTPDVNALVDAARAEKIPVSAVTETLSPPAAQYQDWQTAQLKALLRALGG